MPAYHFKKCDEKYTTDVETVNAGFLAFGVSFSVYNMHIN